MRQSRDSLASAKVCLLYTSPSPRDGLLSISSAASDVYKRQAQVLAAVELSGFPDEDLRKIGVDAPVSRLVGIGQGLSLIHISEPTRRTPLYFVGSVRCV